MNKKIKNRMENNKMKNESLLGLTLFALALRGTEEVEVSKEQEKKSA